MIGLFFHLLFQLSTGWLLGMCLQMQHLMQSSVPQCSTDTASELACIVLQIGAVNAQIMSVPWLSVRAIDLRPCLSSIEQADFLALAPAAEYDVVLCAMVLNCVPTASKRGQMVMNMWQHLRQGGHAFIIIPRRCLDCSPYMTTEHFEAALQVAGFLVSMHAGRARFAVLPLHPVTDPQLYTSTTQVYVVRHGSMFCLTGYCLILLVYSAGVYAVVCQWIAPYTVEQQDVNSSILVAALCKELSSKSSVVLQIKETKLSPKLAFYCIEAVARDTPVNLHSSFAAPPQQLHAASGRTNDFAVCFDAAIIQRQLKALR